MPDSNRRNDFTLIGAIGLLTVLIFFVGWTAIESKTEQRVSEHYARQAEASIRPEDVHLACDGLAPNAITECVIKKYEEHEKWDKDRRDLHAQEDMALWAMWMLIFTALAFLAILGTLYYTRRAADHTEGMLIEAARTTNAAVAAARVSEAARIDQLKGIEVQNRAWLKFDLKFKTAQKDEGGVSFGMDCILENLGVTPATDISLKIELMSINRIIRGGDDFFGRARAEYTKKMGVFHGVDAFPNKGITIPYSGWQCYNGTGPADPVEFAISICYRSAFSDTPHQTGGFFKILQIPEDGTRVFRDEPIFPSIIHRGINT